MPPRPISRLLLWFGLLLPASGWAHPALWEIHDADTTVYLFGTVHLLPAHTDWEFPGLDRALARSDALYLEVADDDQARMAALVLRYGMDATHPLSGLLSPAEFQRLQRAARLAGVPGGASTLNLMRPWLAALTLGVAPLTRAGMDPARGVDRRLRTRMEKAGTPVHGLEHAEQQIRFLADLSQTQQLRMLRDTLGHADEATAEVGKLVAAWQAGDTDAIARIENHDLRDREPDLYRLLVIDRNRRWARRIEALLKHPGTVFVAVGAAHLAGSDSVQTQLRRDGVESTRL